MTRIQKAFPGVLPVESYFPVSLYKSSTAGKVHVAVSDGDWTKENRGVLCGSTARDRYITRDKPFITFWGMSKKTDFHDLRMAYGGRILDLPFLGKVSDVTCKNCILKIDRDAKKLCDMYDFPYDPDGVLVAMDWAIEKQDADAEFVLRFRSLMKWS